MQTNKRVLYILQQSILDNAGKWLSADSNINMASGFFNAWIDQTGMGGFEVDVVIAPINTFTDIKNFQEVFPEHPNLKFIEIEMTPSAALNRMDFSSWEWQKVFQTGRYDLIITCVPEWVLAIKTLLHTMKQPMPKIITQCFWLDTPEIDEPKQPEHITLQWRQAEGFILSDLVVFTCESTKKAWINNSIRIISARALLPVLQKTTVWDFGYSQAEIDSTVPEDWRAHDVARIGFLNRITSDDYTNTHIFIEALRLLKTDPRYTDHFEVVFTNPSKRVSGEWLLRNVPNYKSFMDGKPLSRSEYLQFLYSCDVTTHLFVKERYGGCALRESIASLNFTVVADCHEQGHLVFDPHLKVDAKNLTAEAVADALRYAIDVTLCRVTNDEWMKAQDYREATVDKNKLQCSFESQINIVLSDLYKILEV